MHKGNHYKEESDFGRAVALLARSPQSKLVRHLWNRIDEDPQYAQRNQTSIERIVSDILLMQGINAALLFAKFDVFRLLSEAAKRLKAAGVDWIATSLYGPADFHDDMVRVPGTRDRVIEAIKTLREEGVGVAIKTAISKSTWPHVYDLIAEAKALDVGLIYFCDLITAGRSEGEDDGRITAEQWRELGDFIIEDILSDESTMEWDIGAMPSFIPFVAEKFVERGIDVSNGLERLKTISACPVGKGHMNINSEGGIMPCQFAQDWTIGSIREMSLQDAVSELYKLDVQESKGVCAPEACEYSRICRGCRAKAWQRTGDAMAEDVTCLLHAEFDRSDLVAHIEATPEFDRSAPCSVPGVC